MQKYKSLKRNITGSQITCFWTSTFKQCILTINQYKICQVQLSDENENYDGQFHVGKISKIQLLLFHWFRVYFWTEISEREKKRIFLLSITCIFFWTSVRLVKYLLRICFKRNHSSVLLRRSSLQTQEDAANFILSGSNETHSTSIIWPNMTLKMTICIVLGLSSALYIPFKKLCTQTNESIGTICRALSKPPQRRHYYHRYLCTAFLWPLRLGWLLALGFCKEDDLQHFKCMSVWLNGCWWQWEDWCL